MNLGDIPKIFWYSISVAVLVVSVGLTLIAYRSADVSIDFANRTVQLSAAKADATEALSEAQSLARDLRRENERLARREKNLQKELERLKNQLDELAASAPNEIAAGVRRLRTDVERLETREAERTADEPTIDPGRIKAIEEKFRLSNEQIQQVQIPRTMLR